MTINYMYDLIHQNVKEVRRIAFEYKMNPRIKDLAKVERIETLCKHHSEVFTLINRRTVPKKAEVERICNMSRRLLEKVCKL